MAVVAAPEHFNSRIKSATVSDPYPALFSSRPKRPCGRSRLSVVPSRAHHISTVRASSPGIVLYKHKYTYICTHTFERFARKSDRHASPGLFTQRSFYVIFNVSLNTYTYDFRHSCAYKYTTYTHNMYIAMAETIITIFTTGTSPPPKVWAHIHNSNSVL